MRIIGGDLKGHRLRAPAGLATRPTADAVREALFNILGPPPQAVDTAALDLFAGTGALGIEALSRGIGRVVFVDSGPRACRVLHENLTALSLLSRGEIWKLPVDRALPRLRGPFHWIFADPPYQFGLLPRVLGRLGARDSELLSPDGLVVVEHPRKGLPETDLPGPLHGRLRRVDQRCYGQTGLSFYALSLPEPAPNTEGDP